MNVIMPNDEDIAAIEAEGLRKQKKRDKIEMIVGLFAFVFGLAGTIWGFIEYNKPSSDEVYHLLRRSNLWTGPIRCWAQPAIQRKKSY